MLNDDDMTVTVSEEVVRSLLDAPPETIENESAPPEAIEDENVPLFRYTGTTSRSLHQRGKEHLKGYLKGDENNALFKHSQDKHDGKFVEYEMEIVKQHFSAFSRLIHESVRINRNAKNPQISVLNSKSEWGFNKLPRLVVEKDERTDNKAEQEKNDNDLEIYITNSKISFAENNILNQINLNKKTSHLTGLMKKLVRMYENMELLTWVKRK